MSPDVPNVCHPGQLQITSAIPAFLISLEHTGQGEQGMLLPFSDPYKYSVLPIISDLLALNKQFCSACTL